MFSEVARPVRREATRATPLAQLQWAFEMTEFDAEARQRREGVDDEPTAVAGVVIAFVGDPVPSGSHSRHRWGE